jgi:hypothetical protein
MKRLLIVYHTQFGGMEPVLASCREIGATLAHGLCAGVI